MQGVQFAPIGGEACYIATYLKGNHIGMVEVESLFDAFSYVEI